MDTEAVDEKNLKIVARLLDCLQDNRLVFFVGSGISAEPPTCFPLGKDLRWLVLDGLGFSELGLKAELMTKRDISLELTLGLASRFLGPKVTDIFKVLELRPNDQRMFNRNHYFVPRLASIILTTNQDHLIEDSCACVRPVPLKPVVTERQFEAYQGEDGVLIKIHGSVSEWETLTVTHFETSRLESYKSSAVGAAIKGRAVCFIGYSAQDLDVAESISQYLEEVYWIQRPKQHEERQRWVEKVATNLNLDEEKRRALHGNVIWMDAGTALTFLAQGFDPSIVEDYLKTESSRRELEARYWNRDFKRHYLMDFKKQWASTNPAWKRHAALGTILAHQWQGSRARDAFDAAFKEVRCAQHSEPRDLANILIERARACEAAGKYDEEEKDARHAYVIFNRTEDRIGEAHAAQALAACYHIQDRLDKLLKARRWIQKSKRLFFKSGERGDRQTEAWIVHTDAEILSKMARVFGRLTPGGRTLIRNVINILESRRFREIVSRDVDMETFVTLQLAECYLSLGDLNRVEHQLKQAGRKIDWIGKPQAKDHLHRVTGRLLRKQGHLIDADREYRKALELSLGRKLDEPLLIAKDSIAYARLLMDRHRFRQAYIYLRLAAQTCPGTLGRILFIIGKLLSDIS
jgi:tetratricopeptide (TPR) repeat protein